MVAIPPGGEFSVGTDRFATVLPPDDFDLKNYVILYCILGVQTDTLLEEEAEAAAVEEETTTDE